MFSCVPYSLLIFRAMGLKQQRDHMRAMGQFVPDSDDEEGQEEQQVKQIGHYIFYYVTFSFLWIVLNRGGDLNIKILFLMLEFFCVFFQFLPEPLSEDGVKGRFKTHPWHCGLCNSWFQSITILKFYHR